MSIINLSVEDKRNLARWIGLKSCRLRLIYSADRDGCSPAAFHAKCDNKCPLVAVAKNTAGYVFGGYASMPWVAKDYVHLIAPDAFLFRMKTAGREDYVKFSAVDDKTAVVSYINSGPRFGTVTYTALELFCGAIEKKAGEEFFQCKMNVNISYGFHNNGEDNTNALHGGNAHLVNIEVYSVEASTLYDPESAWRTGLDFTEATLTELKDDITRFQPPKKLFIPKANILLMGQVGAGKSSFYNTINSSFQGHMTAQASCGTAKDSSVTTKYRQYELRPGHGGRALKFRLCDTMGMEEQRGFNISDLPYVLDGHVQNGFQFDPVNIVTPKHPQYQAIAKDKDCIHVVAIVLDCATISARPTKLMEKLQQIMMHAKQRSIPIAVLLTKTDEICEDVNRDVSMVFRSAPVKEAVDMIAEQLGVPPNLILPVKNYSSEHALVTAVDVLSLFTLRYLLRLAQGFFDDQMQQKQLYDDDDDEEEEEK